MLNRIMKGSKHTAPGNPAAKLCGKPINIDVTNIGKDKREETTISPKVSSKCAVKFNKHSYTEDVHTRWVLGGEAGGGGKFCLIRTLQDVWNSHNNSYILSHNLFNCTENSLCATINSYIKYGLAVGTRSGHTWIIYIYILIFLIKQLNDSPNIFKIISNLFQSHCVNIINI